MAKEEHEREDLLQDATGYVRRVEFEIPQHGQPIFCGFRECGSFSVYWTQGDVLQFNVKYELRRGFWQDRMLAAYKHKLHWLEKSEGRVRLQRAALSAAEDESFLLDSLDWLQSVRAAIEGGTFNVKGQVPSDGDVIQDVAAWLEALASRSNTELQIAVHPGLSVR